MFASGAKSFDFRSGQFSISFAEGSTFQSFTAQSGIRIMGNGARLIDNRSYASSNALSIVFGFDACDNCMVTGVGYTGLALASPGDATAGVGYLGAAFVNLKNGCDDFTIEADLAHCRYGVRSGDYSTPSHGYNRNIRTTLTTYRCGYPIAHYLAENVTAEIDAEGAHRAAYLAGVHGFAVNARFKDQFIAPVQVLLTDAKTGAGTSRGCANGSATATDIGSTAWKPNSYCIGISLSRVDPGTVFDNVTMAFWVTSSDTVAATLGGALINSSVVGSGIPGYSYDWEPSITLRNITIAGSIDRSAQTVDSHGFGEIYILADDGENHAATVTTLNFDHVSIINGTGANPRPLLCKVLGLTDQATLTGCNFGNYTTNFVSGGAPFITLP